MIPRTAVLIDGDNMRGRLAGEPEYTVLWRGLLALFGAEAEVHFFLSVVDGFEKARRLSRDLERIGFKVHEIAFEGAYDGNKIDEEIAKTGSQLPSDFDRLVLISGDADFIPLLQLAKTRGLSTTLIAEPFTFRSELREAAQYYLSVEELLKRGGKTGPPSGGHGPDQVYIEKGGHDGAHKLIKKLVQDAKAVVSFLDAYIDDQILMMLKNAPFEVEGRIITSKVSVPDFGRLIEQHRAEGRRLEVYRTGDMHDRFLRVDESWWHSGHSFKDLGSKDSMISRVTDNAAVEQITRKESEIISSGRRLYP